MRSDARELLEPTNEYLGSLRHSYTLYSSPALQLETASRLSGTIETTGLTARHFTPSSCRTCAASAHLLSSASTSSVPAIATDRVRTIGLQQHDINSSLRYPIPPRTRLIGTQPAPFIHYRLPTPTPLSLAKPPPSSIHAIRVRRLLAQAHVQR